MSSWSTGLAGDPQREQRSRPSSCPSPPEQHSYLWGPQGTGDELAPGDKVGSKGRGQGAIVHPASREQLVKRSSGADKPNPRAVWVSGSSRDGRKASDPDMEQRNCIETAEAVQRSQRGCVGQFVQGDGPNY